MPKKGFNPQPVMRFASIGQATGDGGIPVVIASENPVQRYDQERGIVVNEVLLMNGVKFRRGQNKLPIVDSHNDKTVRNIYGSVRNIERVGDQLVGKAYFAADEESQAVKQKMIDGHLDDLSITAMPSATQFIQRGQTYRTPLGVNVEGPAIIHPEWTPHNASVCATGADEKSTVMRSYEISTNATERVQMDEALLVKLTEMGLPEGVTDPNEILAWVIGKVGTPAETVVENSDPVPPETPDAEETEAETTENAMSAEEVQNAVERALKADADRRKEIRSICDLAKVERSFADTLVESHITPDVARQKVLEHIANNQLGAGVGVESVRVTRSEDDKFEAAARDGLLMRAKQSARVTRSLIDGDKPAEGAKDFAQMSLSRLAEACVRRSGVNTDRLSSRDIAMVAMGHRETMRRLRIERSEGAYHTTGSFPALMLDAANKTLLAGYDEAPYTWSTWARQAPSVADFKNINRIRFSESPDLEMVPERNPYPEGPMTDAKETYKVEKFGKMFSVSWETVVNDDLDAISRVPAMHGNAARRTQNKLVYSVLTSNPKMGDGKDLFDATHASGSNRSSAAAAPNVTTLNAAFVAMMTQKGLNQDTILNIQPRFLIVAVHYSATALQLVASLSDPNAGGSAVGNANTLNIYGPNGSRPLQVVVEPLLDASTNTNWYLAADPGQIDTVEMTFLQGEESPVLEQEWDFERDVYRYKIRQTMAAKAIDHRGLYLNAAP